MFFNLINNNYGITTGEIIVYFHTFLYNLLKKPSSSSFLPLPSLFSLLCRASLPVGHGSGRPGSWNGPYSLARPSATTSCSDNNAMCAHAHITRSCRCKRARTVCLKPCVACPDLPDHWRPDLPEGGHLAFPAENAWLQCLCNTAMYTSSPQIITTCWLEFVTSLCISLGSVYSKVYVLNELLATILIWNRGDARKIIIAMWCTFLCSDISPWFLSRTSLDNINLIDFPNVTSLCISLGSVYSKVYVLNELLATILTW